MIRVLAISFVIAASLCGVEPAAAVREASASWRQAIIKQDAAALGRLLAEDLAYSHSSGKTQTKAEYMAAVLKGPQHYESFEESDTKIRVYGKAAVLTGFVNVKTVGAPVYRVRTMEVYTENGGKWQLAGHLSSRIKE
jgi:ketosteroid isomerase-like protein